MKRHTKNEDIYVCYVEHKQDNKDIYLGDIVDFCWSVMALHINDDCGC